MLTTEIHSWGFCPAPCLVKVSRLPWVLDSPVIITNGKQPPSGGNLFPREPGTHLYPQRLALERRWGVLSFFCILPTLNKSVSKTCRVSEGLAQDAVQRQSSFPIDKPRQSQRWPPSLPLLHRPSGIQPKVRLANKPNTRSQCVGSQINQQEAGHADGEAAPQFSFSALSSGLCPLFPGCTKILFEFLAHLTLPQHQVGQVHALLFEQ